MCMYSTSHTYIVAMSLNMIMLSVTTLARKDQAVCHLLLELL